jgi:hypothetical protein
MNTVPRYLAAVTAFVCVSAYASQVLAQPKSDREAAIERCDQQARGKYPYKGGDDSRERARTSTYKNCMFEAGFPH